MGYDTNRVRTHYFWNTTQPSKKSNLTICNDIDGTRGYYAQQNKSEKDNYIISCGIQETKQRVIGEEREK